MDLTPVMREEVETGTIVIDAARRQLIGLKTDTVRRETLVKRIRFAGHVVHDETGLTDVTLRFDGWIGEVTADFTGKFIERGSALFTIYSPELLSAQDEYLEAIAQAEAHPDRGRRLLDSAKRRLSLFGIAEKTLEDLARRGTAEPYLSIYAPVSGTIIEKNIVAGSHVQAGQLLYRMADLSTLWVEAHLWEPDLSIVEIGQEVLLTFKHAADRRIAGRVDYIYPDVEPVVLQNSTGEIKPEMYADLDLLIDLGERLLVPRSAVIFAGESRVAFLDRGEGRLEPRKLETGVQTRESIEVLDGLEEGDSVVTAANFLIAAESRMKAAMDRW
jgi:Cu(I)/Ag(I) efflux system membrane fusion protein